MPGKNNTGKCNDSATMQQSTCPYRAHQDNTRDEQRQQQHGNSQAVSNGNEEIVYSFHQRLSRIKAVITLLFLVGLVTGIPSSIIPGLQKTTYGEKRFAIAGGFAASKGFLAAFYVPLFGSFSDKHGRKTALLASVTLSIVPYCAMVITNSFWFFSFFDATFGVWAATLSLCMAAVIDKIPHSCGMRTESFALCVAMFFTGMGAGPFVGAVLDQRQTFEAALVMQMLAVFFVLFGVQTEERDRLPCFGGSSRNRTNSSSNCETQENKNANERLPLIQEEHRRAEKGAAAATGTRYDTTTTGSKPTETPPASTTTTTTASSARSVSPPLAPTRVSDRQCPFLMHTCQTDTASIGTSIKFVTPQTGTSSHGNNDEYLVPGPTRCDTNSPEENAEGTNTQQQQQQSIGVAASSSTPPTEHYEVAITASHNANSANDQEREEEDEEGGNVAEQQRSRSGSVEGHRGDIDQGRITDITQQSIGRRLIQVVKLSPNLRFVACITFWNFLAVQLVEQLLLLYLQDQLNYDSTDQAIVIGIMSIGALISLTAVVGPLKRRFGVLKALQVALVGNLIEVTLFSVVRTKWEATATISMCLITMAAYPCLSTLASMCVCDEFAGVAQGVAASGRMLAEGISPLVFGLLFDATKGTSFPGSPFLIGSVCVVVALLCSLKLNLPRE